MTDRAGWLRALWIAALAPCCTAAVAASQAPPPGDQLDEVLVVGKQPGPGLWRVSSGDHELWIFATLGPLPKGMIWDPAEVEKRVAQSQAVLAPPRVDPHIGVLRGLMLLPSLLRARHNPDGRALAEVVPHDLYMRWLGLRVKYLGNSSDESLRPMLAAFDLFDHALDREGLTDEPGIWKRIEGLARHDRVPVQEIVLDLKIHDEKSYVRDLTQISPQSEVACLRATIEHLEEDLPALRERANLWSLGRVRQLRPLLPADEPIGCFDAVMSVARFRSEYDEVTAQLDALWMRRAEEALHANRSTVAVVPIKRLLEDDGWLVQLRSHGLAIEEPDR